MGLTRNEVNSIAIDALKEYLKIRVLSYNDFQIPIIRISNKTRRVFGRYSPTQNKITLSYLVMGSKDKIYSTVLHEMIHWEEFQNFHSFDARHGHGRFFHSIMKEINDIYGENFITVTSRTTVLNDMEEPVYAYVYIVDDGKKDTVNMIYSTKYNDDFIILYGSKNGQPNKNSYVVKMPITSYGLNNLKSTRKADGSMYVIPVEIYEKCFNTNKQEFVTDFPTVVQENTTNINVTVYIGKDEKISIAWNDNQSFVHSDNIFSIGISEKVFSFKSKEKLFYQFYKTNSKKRTALDVDTFYNLTEKSYLQNVLKAIIKEKYEEINPYNV